MTDKRIKELAYNPLLETWSIIHEVQNLKPEDTAAWNNYIQRIDAFHAKHDSAYGRALERAIIDIVDVIAKENGGKDDVKQQGLGRSLDNKS